MATTRRKRAQVDAEQPPALPGADLGRIAYEAHHAGRKGTPAWDELRAHEPDEAARWAAAAAAVIDRLIGRTNPS